MTKMPRHIWVDKHADRNNAFFCAFYLGISTTSEIIHRTERIYIHSVYIYNLNKAVQMYTPPPLFFLCMSYSVFIFGSKITLQRCLL